MGGAWGTYGGEVQTGFWWGNLRERDHLEDLGTDISMGKVNTVRNFGFPKMRGIS